MSIHDFIASGKERLDRQLLFTAEIDQMTAVLRRTVLIDKSRRENDAEHSWHIAVMAMLFKEYAKEPVDVGRVVQMCVVHDLIEIYAGDTFAYDAEGNRDKKAREEAAADRLYAMLPAEQGALLRSLWEEFDAMETADAKYAACMDRLQPFLHNTLTDGHTWVEGETDRQDVEARMAVIREFMPEVYAWMSDNMDHAVEKGWLRDKKNEVNGIKSEPKKKVHVVAAIIHRGKEIFATQRGYGPYKDWWEFPGGKIEAGETAEEALVREIREELDTEIAIEKYFITIDYDYPEFHLTMDCFWCSLKEEHLTLIEHEAARWLSADNLEQVNWLPADVQIIEKIREKMK